MMNWLSLMSAVAVGAFIGYQLNNLLYFCVGYLAQVREFKAVEKRRIEGPQRGGLVGVESSGYVAKEVAEVDHRV